MGVCAYHGAHTHTDQTHHFLFAKLDTLFYMNYNEENKRKGVDLMKRIFALFLALSLCLPLFSCGEALTPATAEEQKTQAEKEIQTKEKEPVKEKTTEATPAETKEAYTPTDSESIDHPLDGKRFIFIGNSYTYYGRCVLPKPVSNFSQVERNNDKGYFYQIAKANGADVKVTNWTYGSHSLEDTFGGNCTRKTTCAGRDHAADLANRYYDYVMIQERSSGFGDFLGSVDTIMAFFREANPNVKFFLLVPIRPYEVNKTDCKEFLANLKKVEEKGVTVVNWGKICYDVYKGTTAVPEGQLEYDRNSFIISQSEADGYHQNLLAGYITALMTWCAITGDSAVGQEYLFTGDPTVNKAFNFTTYKSTYYKYGKVVSNFDKALQSETEVLGFQKLIDQYLAAKEHLTY